jgi:predicted metal-dependent hydrolase
VLDYLAAHEASYLVELNRSPKSWRLLKRLNPDDGRAKAWLDTQGTVASAWGNGEGGRGSISYAHDD